MRYALAAILLTLAFQPALPAQADDCDTALAARIKGIHTAQHSEFHLVIGGNVDMGSSDIRVDGQHYSKRIGAFPSAGWEIKPWDQAQEEANYRKGFALETRTCRIEGSDIMGGETADIFLIEGGATTLRLWVGRTSGRPYKEEVQLTKGDTAATVWGYDGVKAPDTK
ncbi:MAG TPA: hypothetical protein VGG48_05520 [Rhizomicrobium sp.]|jgi:hypothetical protein